MDGVNILGTMELLMLENLKTASSMEKDIGQKEIKQKILVEPHTKVIINLIKNGELDNLYGLVEIHIMENMLMMRDTVKD